MALYKKVTASVKKVLSDKEVKETEVKKEEGLKKAAEVAAAQLDKEAESNDKEE